MKLSYALLLGAVLCAPMVVLSQTGAKPEAKSVPESRLEAAVTFNPLVAGRPMSSGAIGGDNFLMKGGSGQLDGRLWRNLSLTADFSGEHTRNMEGTGVGLDLLTITFGPRYSWQRNHYTLYGQMLAGEAFGRNSVFPAVNGPTSSANSLVLLGGGGINRQLSKRVALRLFEADWVHTQLPNSTTNAQNDLRLGTGLVVRIR
jgi:peptidoglycan-associated lipoprotein